MEERGGRQPLHGDKVRRIINFIATQFSRESATGALAARRPRFSFGRGNRKNRIKATELEKETHWVEIRVCMCARKKERRDIWLQSNVKDKEEFGWGEERYAKRESGGGANV